MSIDGKSFLDVVRPALQAGDPHALAQAITSRWLPVEICLLLQHHDVDVRRVAAVTLGLVGDMSIVPCLAVALLDTDEQVNQMAEHGLWSIWFRGGSIQAARPFRQGVAALGSENYVQAIAHFREATHIDPDFAEAYNQCAIAHFFLGQWKESIKDCRRTLDLVPVHFLALAGMGHGYTELGEINLALECYRKALKINPRMTAIRRACERIEARLQNDSSGFFHVDQVPV